MYSFVFLDVQSDGCTLGPRPTESHNNPTPFRKLEINPLMTRNAPINRISILKVSRISNDKTISEIRANERFIFCDGVTSDLVDYFLCFCRVEVFIVVAGEECSAVSGPEVLEDGADCGGSWGGGLGVYGSDDVEPSYDCP